MDDSKIKLINDYASFSLSRDIATKEYLDSLGCSNNLLGGCPTLFINEIPQHYVPLIGSDKTDCLISIRTPTLMSIPVVYQYRLRDQLVEIIELLKKEVTTISNSSVMIIEIYHLQLHLKVWNISILKMYILI